MYLCCVTINCAKSFIYVYIYIYMNIYKVFIHMAAHVTYTAERY